MSPVGHVDRLTRGCRSRLCPIAAASALLLALAGCSVKQGENPNLILGKQQFVAKCGSCHTLARANTRGIVGPNLAEAFPAAANEAHRRSAIRGRARLPRRRRT